MPKFLDQLKSFSLKEWVDKLVDKRILVLIIISAIVISGLIISLIALGISKDNKEIQALIDEEKRMDELVGAGSSIPTADDFIFPEECNIPIQTITPLRKIHKSWSEEEIEPYWIDIDDIDMSDFSEKNRALVESMLDLVE